jgi:uncharacterized protein YyaL (SSP411 family)
MGQETAPAGNRLEEETSPYLLQHAHNPVAWQAWGSEAFALAREQDRPVFLSVGYSTCYWCHVMERESFENAAVAAEMNRLLVSIKVDREERPDVDQLYMTAVQLMTRHGGWPMSVFLLPDGRPFFGGTYFPPTDSPGRPGFVTLIRALADAYHNRRADVEGSAGQIISILRQLAEPPVAKKAMRVDQTFCNELVRASLADYDPQHGGFGMAPKFPRQTLLELLLVHETIVPDANRMTLVSRTLSAMADGGIRDHLGGGFHRYSTDAAWLVPHFEIMLYDNALLGWVYAEAAERLKIERFARVARGIFDFVLREMTDGTGGFYTALDAETDAREGATYLWTIEEVREVLGIADAGRFAAVYGLDRGPNFADPHHGSGRPDRSVLYLPGGAKLEDDPAIVAMRGKLLEHRRRRAQPRLDDKILTSWNGLMIRGLAHAGRILDEPRYVAAAAKAADFLWEHHRTADGGLLRTSRKGPAKLLGHLDDYAFFAQGLVALARAEVGTAAAVRRAQAQEIVEQMCGRFGGDGQGIAPVGNGKKNPRPILRKLPEDMERGKEVGGLFFTDAGADDLIVRQKLASDSPLPSGNAIAAQVLLELGRKKEARDIIAAFAPMMDEQGEAMSAMVQSAALYVQSCGPIDVMPSSTPPPPMQSPGQPTAQPATPSTPERPPTPQRSAEDVVDVDIEVFDEQTIEVTLNIRDGYHLNSEDAASPLIPTKVEFHSDVLTVKQIDYPWGTEKPSPPGEAPPRVFECEVSIVINLRARSDSGTKAKVVLQYQPCDEKACLPAVTKTFEVDLPRMPESQPPQPSLVE